MRKLDLNLLIVLYDLVQTCSTTRTADRLARTQPVISQSLGRLRRFFDDPLLIRHGPTLTPSPLALRLVPSLEAHLRGIGNLIVNGGEFDPAKTARDVVISGVDITLGLQMSIVARLRQLAPGLRISLDALNTGVASLASGETDLLLALYPEQPPGSIARHPLAAMEWGVLAAAHHPISDEPSLEEWLSYAHVQVSTGAGARSPINDALNALGVDRTIGLQTRLFLSALHAVAASDMLFTTLTGLAEDMAERLKLRRVTLPIDVPAVPAAILVRESSHDAFSAWLASSIRGCLPEPLPESARSSSRRC